MQDSLSLPKSVLSMLSVMSQDVSESIKVSILARLPQAVIAVRGAGGHFEIAVTAASFAGQSTLERQRTVLSAIAHLMKGDNAPVHAVDSLKTSV